MFGEATTWDGGAIRQLKFNVYDSILFHTARDWPKTNQTDRAGIPHICHFFYTDRIFENQILHQKKRLNTPKTLKMSLKKSNICIFFTQSGKIYT